MTEQTRCSECLNSQIKLTDKNEMTDKEKILDQTHNGLTVFIHYIGESCQRKIFKNPYRDDRNPSCHLYRHKGVYVIHDFGCSDFHGDCFWFVGWLNNLNVRTQFRNILEIIDKDLNLSVLSNSNGERREIVHPIIKNAPEAKEMPQNKRFYVKYKNYSSEDIEYWGRYGITENILQAYGVRNVMMLQSVNSEGKNFEIASTYKPLCMHTHLMTGKGLRFTAPSQNIILPFFRTSA